MKQRIIITIGRQFGAGGRSVAAELGRMLDIPVYDNDLLSQAAIESGFPSDMFKKRDEKRNLFGLARLFSSREYNATNYMGDNALFQMQSETIRHIASKGSCIIIGRCADYVLRDDPAVVSVFLTSPLDVRARRVSERMGVDNATALKIIGKKERSRAAYYNGYTLGKWGDSSTYRLCIDSSVLGIEGTAQLIRDFINRAQEDTK